jgi:hypothetical protein
MGTVSEGEKGLINIHRKRIVDTDDKVTNVVLFCCSLDQLNVVWSPRAECKVLSELANN